MVQAYQDRYVTIFDAAVNGSGAWFKVRDLMAGDAGVVTLLFAGTWNSGTMTIEVSANGAALNAVSSTDTLTADGEITIAKSPDCYIRATLSGSGGGAIVGTAQ
jgi:hypothetical protein